MGDHLETLGHIVHPPGPGVCRTEEECIITSPLSLPSRVSLAKMVRQELQAPLDPL